MEWAGPPQNFLDLPTLKALFEILSPHYVVIYVRPLPKDIVDDNSEILDLGESALLKRVSARHHDTAPSPARVRSFHEHASNDGHGQLPTIHFCSGGNSVLASYFGGDNIVFMRQGLEMYCGDYDRFGDFANTRVITCSTYSGLLEQVRKAYVEPLSTGPSEIE
jgi:hypothetical protein